ncbi:ferredoxin [Deinococcus sp.]|uniref:(2Fe-2S) ferredoxin domain-containing protein n=1 Tax=Deinococcus sp. TaxID=47478 RepID=UPI0025C4F88C|nr:NAD(P)H-dependent oxidoreductase subunit E [Deinococcus sp.]
MPAKFFPTNGHLLICQNSQCLGRGSGLLYRALWNYLERESLAYYKAGGTVRLTESGCLGACSYGPAMCVYRRTAQGLEESWYGAADFPLACAIAQAVQQGGALPSERRYGPEP